MAKREDSVDLLIVGGGVNGVGIARDAVGRGLSVALVEMNDLASATSSASSKLIHGGLRYLEHYEFRLVREALAEREVLLRAAPHIIWPLCFVLPHVASLRPAWMIRLGLFLYDHLGGPRSLPGSRAVDLTRAEFAGLREEYRRGFSYADCWVDDARLVALLARDAADQGASIATRTRLVSARREGDHWRADVAGDATRAIRARALVNAAGPWVGSVLGGALGLNSPARLRLVKGSHIVVPRRYPGAHAFILQNDDRRVVFVIPYEGDYTLIGTTDTPYDGEPGAVSIAPDEIAYLCAAASRYLAHPVTPADVVWSYAGVRPLYDDGSAAASEVTRDYVLELDAPAGHAPALSVFGGKITTFRRLAEEALAHLAPFFPAMKPAWTAGAILPGGDLAGGFEHFLAKQALRYDFVPAPRLRALARRHGDRIARLLEGVDRIEAMGEHFGHGLYALEVDFLRREEWAVTAEDVLYRRTKKGLHLTPEQRAAVGDYIARTPLRKA